MFSFLSSMAWQGQYNQFISANIDGIISEKKNNITSSQIISRWRRFKGRQACILTKTIPVHEGKG